MTDTTFELFYEVELAELDQTLLTWLHNLGEREDGETRYCLTHTTLITYTPAGRRVGDDRVWEATVTLLAIATLRS